MSGPVIAFDGLTKYYGDVRGVEDLSFSIEEGEVFGFLGPNGAGKSTAIRLLLGLLAPTDGAARLLGHDVTDRSGLLEAKRNVGYIPDDAAFYEQFTGEELLDYFAGFTGDARRDELAERFDFPADRRVKEYSRGNRQKLSIVQAFMHDPDVLVMDEPTSGLDPLLQNEFYDLVNEERDRGTTVFFSSHILGEVRRLCDRVAIIREGTLVALEDIETLLAKSGKVVHARFAERPDPDRFDFEGVARADVTEDGALELVLTENYDALIDRLDERHVEDLEIRETSLEDVFIHFYGRGEFTGEERRRGAVAEDLAGGMPIGDV